MNNAVRRTTVTDEVRQSELKKLVERIALRQQTAISALYDATSSVLYALALRILSRPEDAEEVVCDVFGRVWRNAASYDEMRGSVMAWLILMTRSISIDRLRLSRRQEFAVTGAHDAGEPLSPEASPEAGAVSQERAVRVRQALASLSSEQRHTLELAFFGGLSHGEIAEREHLPLGTVKTRIRTGLARLRAALGETAV